MKFTYLIIYSTVILVVPRTATKVVCMYEQRTSIFEFDPDRQTFTDVSSTSSATRIPHCQWYGS